MFKILILFNIVASTLMYLYLHKKTRMNIRYLYMDNLAVIILVSLLSYMFYEFLFNAADVYIRVIGSVIIPVFFIPVFGYAFTMIRFWRTPIRKVKSKQNEIISPVDGNVLYIKEIEKGNIPVSIKRGLKAKLTELTDTEIINGPVWLIGVNMTPFDVHKNCTPVAGKVILNKHIKGEFLSLKHPESILRNERNTLVIKTEENELFGIIQTASKMVRRIDSYVSTGDNLKQGQWFGMIRFGSQVDIILPVTYDIKIKVKQQLYAIKTIIAKK